MSENQLIDHFFRHQYGKMVSVFTRIFGLHHLELIEDAIQDTFISALKSWQKNKPDNPEAWLTKVAKNRILDLLRKISAEDKRIAKIQTGIDTYAINELFLEDEIDDSILRMIFAACNPKLDARDQIAFALKIISGFSQNEIAAALLLKVETVKKRLARAKKAIKENQISFEIPRGNQLKKRLNRVLEVIYLIFNEGFHSLKKDFVLREELCGEAIRLCNCLLKKPLTATPDAYALFAVFCFQAARLKSRVNQDGELISLRDQDRSLWYFPMVELGHENMRKAVSGDSFGFYHYEAAILAEHLQSDSFEETNWQRILVWYQNILKLETSPLHLLNLAIIHLELKDFNEVKNLLGSIEAADLEQRAYLYHGTYAEYEFIANKSDLAIKHINKAIEQVPNESTKTYLQKRKRDYLNELNQ